MGTPATMIPEQTVVQRYGIKIKSQTGSGLTALVFESRFAAEQHLATLPMELRTQAEIIPLTGEGKQVLFG